MSGTRRGWNPRPRLWGICCTCPKGSSMTCPISSVAKRIQLMPVVMRGTRTGLVDSMSAKGRVTEKSVKKRDVWRE